MSDAQRSPVPLRILDREYLVACTPEERAGLLQAAQMVDEKMREIRGQAKVLGLDRLAVMTALTIAHDSISQQEALGGLTERLRELNRRMAD
ncbi:MAG: cell division protein ZapA [Xanthomonadales bacterium]|nr:cell division protein ZapA [Xanthomonadales bacterium]MCB1627033.1 cell division protein ZapA [Xanthomonadales bacterium]MCB1636243.1 cell division protein ZapA [Xanthomonadales bacterium]MCB1641411.1 cell division protein ZapA [Xanthomonadales bacterium]